MALRLSFGLGLFIGSLALGWCLARRAMLTELRAAHLVRWIVTRLSPVVLCLSFWTMELGRVEPWLLPLLGLLISVSTIIPALAYARRAALTRPQTGSFLTCAIFSNVGYLGAFTAFALFGEAAYALCVLYMVSFTPGFYTLGFWIASRCGTTKQASSAETTLQGEFRLYPFVGMAAGLVLNVAGVPRPLALAWLNHALIPLGTALYLIAIGSQLTLDSPRPWLKPCLAMSAIKFLYTPLIALGLLSLFRVQGLPRLVVLLEASTPVAVSPLVLPLLFGLDRKLANALWLFTTLLSIPWFILLAFWLQRL